ncbi:unnamed protein product [Rotaria sordida]|uniref:Uncharacterized protein n=1 Tax=Rotaria sordida TaxID=392033 RepID=A0A819KY26_9BILA|nr:unnamed protein product [Rotaria sordida]
MQSNIIPMESLTEAPIIDLDGENDNSVLLLAKSLGYFYIPRSSTYGHLPDCHALKLLAEKLFNLSMDEKFAFGSNYIRSINLNEPPSKKESISLTRTNQKTLFTSSVSMKTLFDICEQVSVHLIDILQLNKQLSSTTPNTILFNHYIQINEPLIIHQSEISSLQFHLYSTCHLQRLAADQHEWKSIEYPVELSKYILVTLPNFIYRYSTDSLSNYTIDYLMYNVCDSIEKRTYFLSLKQNKILRYITFFYLYIMQGVPAGFSSTALANYLTAEGEQSSTVGTFVSLSSLPWALQFVWGPLIDRFQSSPMGRRRPWVIGAQTCAFLASLGLLFVRDPPTKYIKTLVIAFFIHSIFASIQDASVDAQAITTIPLNERGRINGFMRGGFLVGISLGAAGLAWMLRNWSYLGAASVNSLFLLIFTVITFFIKENSNDQLLPCRCRKGYVNRQQYENRHNYSILRLFIELFKGLFAFQSLRLFIPILLVYTCQSAFIRAYNIHLIKVLGWSDTSVSILSGIWGTLIPLGVALIGGWLADFIGARYLLIIAMFINAIYMLTVNLIESYWYQRSVATTVLILSSMMDPILSTAAMPVLMALCRTHVEGSQFTTYMSLANLSDLAGAFVSGHLQQQIRANIIGLGCAVLIIIASVVVTFSVWHDKRRITLVSVSL